MYICIAWSRALLWLTRACRSHFPCHTNHTMLMCYQSHMHDNVDIDYFLISYSTLLLQCWRNFHVLLNQAGKLINIIVWSAFRLIFHQTEKQSTSSWLKCFHSLGVIIINNFQILYFRWDLFPFLCNKLDIGIIYALTWGRRGVR